MKRIALILAAMMIVAVPAEAKKTRTCNDCKKYDKVVRGKAAYPDRMQPCAYSFTNFERLDDNKVLVEFSAVIPKGFVEAKEAFVFSPVVVSGENQIALDPIAICGKKYYKANNGAEDGVTYILFEGEQMPVSFQKVVDAVDDEKSAVLMVGQDRKCICEEIGRYTDVSLDNVARGMFPMGYLKPRYDIPAILGKNAAALFYIPASYYDSETEEEVKYDGGCAVLSDGLVRSYINKPAGFIQFDRAKEIVESNCLSEWINNAMCAAMEAGDLEQAQKYADCLGEDDINAAIASNLMVLNTLTGNYEAAEAFHTKTVSDPDVAYNYALLLLRMDRKEEAKEILKYFYR